MYKDATDFIPQNLRFTPRTVLKKTPRRTFGGFYMGARGAPEALFIRPAYG